MKEALKSLTQALREKEIEKIKWWIATAIKDLVDELPDKK